MASEMVQRVANKIYIELAFGNNLKDAHKEIQNLYLGIARAAIEAMREPTIQQRNNYYEMRKEVGETKAIFIDSYWQEMIDAALKE